MSTTAVADPPAPGTEDDLARKRAEAAGTQEPDPQGSGAAAGGDDGAEPDGDFPGEDGIEQGPAPIAIQGEGQLSLTVGGLKPDKASVKLRGGSIDLPAGQLKKGDVQNLLIKVRVTEVHLVDKMDNSTGEVVETERRHIAKIMGVEKVSV